MSIGISRETEAGVSVDVLLERLMDERRAASNAAGDGPPPNYQSGISAG